MIKLIVFDCDGVMFDSRQANKKYYNHLLNHFDLPPMNEEELEFVHMHNATDSVKHIFRHHPHIGFDSIEQVRLQLGYGPFLPYMVMEEDLIDFLSACEGSYHLAISTNRTNTMIPLLQTFNLEKYFGIVMTAENAKRPKPAPDALLTIMDHYSCSPEDTIFIGDSIIDRLHSSACNVPLIAFKNSELDAEYHVSTFMEIFTLAPFQG